MNQSRFRFCPPSSNVLRLLSAHAEVHSDQPALVPSLPAHRAIPADASKKSASDFDTNTWILLNIGGSDLQAKEQKLDGN